MAIRDLRTALAYFEEVNHYFDIAACYYNLGWAYLNMDSLDIAEDNFKYVITISDKIAIHPSDRKKAALEALAVLSFKRKDYNESILYLNNAIKEFNKEKVDFERINTYLGKVLLKKGNLKDSELAFNRALNHSPSFYDALSGLALLEEFRSNYSKAAAYHRSAVAAASSQTNQNQGSAVLGMTNKTGNTFAQAARFYWRIGKPEKAFELLETGRARYLSQLLNLANIKTDKSASTDSIKNIEKQIGELYRKPESGLSTHQLQILVLEAAREHLLDSVKKYSPHLYAFKKTKIPTLQELQTTLGSEFQLIEYSVMDDSVFALAVNSEKVTGHVIQIRRDSLERMIDRVITAKQPSLQDLQELYWLLIEPMEKNLQPGKTLVIIPDDALFRLPFEMLVKSHDGNYRSAKYLLREYPVSYAVSASVWLDRLGRHSRAPKNYAGFAATVFDTLSALPFVKSQIDDAANRFFNSSSWTDDSNLHQLFVNRAGKYKIIDLATHAFVSDIEPMRSKIVFNEHGGEMNAFEIYELDLDADLAVLSACGTGLGKLSAGEGFMGFNQAFSYAGVYSLILSMWNVDDEATQLILKVFYEKLADGMPRAQALQEAKLEYLANGYELKLSPRYWAGLTLWGNPTPVILTQKPYEIWIIAFCVAGLVLLGFYLNGRKHD